MLNHTASDKTNTARMRALRVASLRGWHQNSSANPPASRKAAARAQALRFATIRRIHVEVARAFPS